MQLFVLPDFTVSYALVFRVPPVLQLFVLPGFTVFVALTLALALNFVEHFLL